MLRLSTCPIQFMRCPGLGKTLAKLFTPEGLQMPQLRCQYVTVLILTAGLFYPTINVLRAAENVKLQSEILDLILKESPKPKYGVPVPEKITGRVLMKSKGVVSGIPGVSVMDGYSVVKTNKQGFYLLTPHPDAVFVNITRPSGFDVKGDWYQPLAEKINFQLKPSQDDENEYIFVHVTDTHISEDPVSLAGLSRFVQEVNKINPKPRFVLNSGDLLNLSKTLASSPESGRASFRNYVGIMNHLSMPHYNVAGDHTDSSYLIKEFPRGDHRCGKPLYWEFLGPHFFSFEYGKIHFVSVDYGYHLGQKQRKGPQYPTYMVQPMHTKWLNEDMSSRSKGTYVVTSSEYDLIKHCPDFLTMAKQHDIRLQLVGDHHIVAHKSRPVPYRIGGALSGCWWNPKANQLCPDLSPQGYVIYRVNGEKMEQFYKGLGQRIAFQSDRIGAPWKGEVILKAHLVQPQPNEKLEYSFNGMDWMAMKEIARPFIRVLFSAKIDSTQLAEGHLKISIRSTRTKEVQSRNFVVVNGGISPRAKTEAILSFKVGKRTHFMKPEILTGKVAVLFNGEIIGELTVELARKYEFRINPSQLGKANILSFHFTNETDTFCLNSPVLKIQGKEVRDPRDTAIRKVKTAHWGTKAVDWGGFIIGNAEPPDETPFYRKQNQFCFVLDQTM